jgi:SAM-dependent methyltransferase
MAKDNFSAQAASYSKYRPEYPLALFDWLLAVCPGREAAWDCATGNGQVAHTLAQYFKQVTATDISEQQLKQAVSLPNVQYELAPAEQTHFLDHSFDLITVGQALHWFDFGRFFTEAQRVLKPGGLLATFGYGLVRVVPSIDVLVSHFYLEIVGPYWDQERRHVDHAYQSIPFPWPEIQAPSLSTNCDWTVDQFLGYLSTWSAVQHYLRQCGQDPLLQIETALRNVWGPDTRRVSFPVFVKAAWMPAKPSGSQTDPT